MAIFYVSSYGSNSDKGIYIVNFEENTHSMKLLEHRETQDYPSYMITKENTLYVAFKNAGITDFGGGVGSFSITGNTLVSNTRYGSSGRSYTHLCVDTTNTYLFAANYHVGTTVAYALQDHCISKKIGAIHHQGCGPDSLKRQTSPHVHYVNFTPDKEFLYAVDLGSDKVVMYRYQNGQLEESKDHTLNVVPGSGPRHMIFSKDGKFAYLVNEISNTLMVFKYTNKHFTLIQAIPTTPRHFTGFSSASAIRLTNCGKHLFISNRGHDSIALYRVNQETGKALLLYMVHTGKNPRDFNILDDKYVFVGAQEDNVLELFTFDEESEQLVRTSHTLPIPQPVCITIKK